MRYTSKGENVYAIILGMPKAGSILLRAFAEGWHDISKVTMVGLDEKIEWQQEKDGIRICFPEKLPCEHAYVFRLQ